MGTNKISFRYIVSVLLFGFFLILGFVYRSLLLAYLIEPLAQAFWLILRVFLSIDQSIYLVGLIIAVVVMAFRLIPVRSPENTRYQYFEPQTFHNRVEYWRSIFEIPDSNNKKVIVRENLLRLVMALSDQKIDEIGAEPSSQLAAWRASLPPDITSFLFPGEVRKSSLVQNPLRNLNLWLSKRNSEDYFQSIDKVFQFIDTYMEIELDEYNNRVYVHSGSS